MTGDWEYDAFIVSRVARTVEVSGSDGTRVIEKDTLTFGPVNTEDLDSVQAGEEFVRHLSAPDNADEWGRGRVSVPHVAEGILEFPEPMTDEEAGDWLSENPDRWQQFVDETLECDMTAGDLLDSVR